MPAKSVFASALVFPGAFCVAAESAEYETGGPLAAVKLPLHAALGARIALPAGQAGAGRSRERA